jgi:hypothetical protein
LSPTRSADSRAKSPGRAAALVQRDVCATTNELREPSRSRSTAPAIMSTA